MKFRKKPVVIEAVQFTSDMYNGHEPLPEGVQRRTSGVLQQIYIRTLEGEHSVSIGDWIITGVMGEKYPCKPDIFDKTYEPVMEP